MGQITKIIVLFIFCLTGCFATTAPAYVYHTYPLTDNELASLTVVERQYIASDSNIYPLYFPEAVVYETYQLTENSDYQKYEQENSRSLPNGAIELPAMEISVRTHDVFRSPKMIVRTTHFKECIPGTDKCDSSVSQEVVVFRDHFISIPREQLNFGSGNVARRTDGRTISMLELTKDTINTIIVKAKVIRERAPAIGDCKELNFEGHHSYLDEPLDAKLVTFLTNTNSEYLPYSEIEKTDNMLAEYNFAKNGCYDNDLERKLRAIKRGESILNAIFG